MNDDQKPLRDFEQLDDIVSNLFPGLELENSVPEVAPKKRRKRSDTATAAIVSAAAEIMTAPDETELAYMARELVLCTLPHKDPGKDTTVWMRSNGHFTLIIQSGINPETGEPYGLPFGIMPRMILLWMFTKAVQEKTSLIELTDKNGESHLNAFLREIGYDPNTGRGKRGDAKRLKEQFIRLLNANISFVYQGGDDQKGAQGNRKMPIADEHLLWWDFKSPNQGSLFKSVVRIGAKIFESLTKHPVPTDRRALKALRRNTLGFDLYIWTQYRRFTMGRARSLRTKISWTDLQEQFGSSYTRLRDFKKQFLIEMEVVRTLAPGTDYAHDKNAFTLENTKRSLPVAPADKAAAKGGKLDEFSDLLNNVTEKGRAEFQRRYRGKGLDVDTCIEAFYFWREQKSQVSGDPDAHFLGFAKTWVEQRSKGR